MNPPTDTENLIELARSGDAAAGQAAIASHRDRLRRMVAVRLDRRLAARVDPSDVVQEALTEAVTALPAYLRRSPLPFYPWLRQFAWERLAKLHRRHIRAKRRSVTREERLGAGLSAGSTGLLTRTLVSPGTTPSECLMRDESRRRVREAINRLPASERHILIMRNLQSLSTAEIAAVLGVSEGAAKVRHLRALRRLQPLLEDLR